MLKHKQKELGTHISKADDYEQKAREYRDVYIPKEQQFIKELEEAINRLEAEKLCK